MHAWESIEKTLEYIETHISSDISVDVLADIAGLSPFYYQRLFARLVKQPVMEYIKLRRLAKSCQMLENGEHRIFDIALDIGFKSHETYARAFKATYKITPTDYRQQHIVLDHFEKPSLSLNYVMVDEGVPLVCDDMVLEYQIKQLEKPMYFVGVKGYYAFTKGKMFGQRPGISEPSLIWHQFFEILDDIEPSPNASLIGVSYPGDAKEGYSSYFVGIQTDKQNRKEHLSDFQMPARDYLVCMFEASNEAELMTTASAKAMTHTRLWLKKHGYIADGFFPEIYPRFKKKVAYMELWIPFKNR